MVRDPLDYCVGFDWDEGNIDKNWYKHHKRGTVAVCLLHNSE